jgi:hypothetical protein
MLDNKPGSGSGSGRFESGIRNTAAGKSAESGVGSSVEEDSWAVRVRARTKTRTVSSGRKARKRKRRGKEAATDSDEETDHSEDSKRYRYRWKFTKHFYILSC